MQLPYNAPSPNYSKMFYLLSVVDYGFNKMEILLIFQELHDKYWIFTIIKDGLVVVVQIPCLPGHPT